MVKRRAAESYNSDDGFVQSDTKRSKPTVSSDKTTVGSKERKIAPIGSVRKYDGPLSDATGNKYWMVSIVA